ncbi:hypothetical protein KAR91_44675 [Candidatus Pacearchaeota archaeon]|nr:hypothetical protein [Candidatus Pacearchaeota archaeon]
MGNSIYIAPVIEGTESLMTTDLNSLADTAVNVGAVLPDNTSNRYFYAKFELVLASVDLSGKVNPAVELYLVPSYDGTNFADVGTDASTTVYPPMQYFVAALGVAETSSAHRAVSTHILLDPVKYTPVVINMTGAALAASGNTLKSKYYTVTGA